MSGKKRKKSSKKKGPKVERRAARASEPRCGLCGKRGKLVRTECCGSWICDDVENYKPFSYARNSCYRNHDHYTLCAFHWHEEHESDDWRTCPECRESFEKTEEYVWFGTNEYNFVKLENPPAYEPTTCSGCGVVLDLGEDGYAQKGDEYLCEKCLRAELPDGFPGL